MELVGHRRASDEHGQTLYFADTDFAGFASALEQPHPLSSGSDGRGSDRRSPG
jgi:hypothetical protein